MTVTISGAGRRFQLVGVGLLLVALAIALFARPAAAAVTGSATPSTGLGDTGTLMVTASGFATGDLHTVHVLECEHGATSSDQCDANTDDGSVSTNVSGNYTNNAYTYFVLPNAVFGGNSSIVCDSTHACDLVLIQDDYNNFSNPHVNIPITFSAVAPTTIPPTTIPPTTNPNQTTPTTAPATTTPIGNSTTVAGATTTGGPTTTAAGGTTGDTTTTTKAGGAGTTVGGQGTGVTLATDPGGLGSGGSGGSGGTLPFTGPPTAAPIVAICGIVILLAGTVMRRVVLRVPNSGVSLS